MSKVFIISGQDAIELCVGVGFGGAPRWDVDRLLKKIKVISSDPDYSDLEVGEDIVEDDARRERGAAAAVEPVPAKLSRISIFS